MKKKALFLDIDYTLFSPRQGIVPPSAEAAVRKARENGHYVFLCTGRSQAEARKYQNFPVDGFIYANGAACFVKGKNIYDHPISEENVNRIREMIERHHMGVLIGGARNAYLDDICYPMISSYLSGSEPDPEIRMRNLRNNGMASMREWTGDDPVYKLGATKPHQDSFDSLSAQLPPHFRLVQTLSSENGDFGEISDSTNKKSDGILRILEHLGMSKEDAVGIGDSGNDTDMLEICGIGIAMGNGSEEVKTIADWITTDVDEDGIRNAFVHIGVI